MSDNESRDTITKLIIGTVLFLTSFIFDNFISTSLLLASYLVLGFEVLKEAVENIIHGDFLDESFLMTFATIAALILKDYTEAVFVMLFYSIGEFLQDLAYDTSRKRISELVNLTPAYVHVDGKDVKPEEVSVGTVFKVLPGERIAIDGIVVKGHSFLDTKSITGESLPFECRDGSRVISGSIVLDSPIEIRSTSSYKNSTAGRILQLIENNNETKAKSEKFINKFSHVYTPIVVSLAIVVAVIPSIITKEWNIWIYRALNFLVISCPCALVLSVPLAFFACMGSNAGKGILIKGAQHIEKLAKTKAVVFDKTGTITTGTFEVLKVLPHESTQDKILSYAYSLEKSSNHPIAKAICSYCVQNKIPELSSTDTVEKPGFGLTGTVNGQRVLVGNYNLLRDNKIDFFQPDVNGSVTYISCNNIYLGCIVVGDQIKNEAKQVMYELKKLGIKQTVILSGDKEKNVSSVAKDIGIDTWYSQLLPFEKETKIDEIKSKYVCAYLGDGINDIPVMMKSDIAISMGTIGSDAAVEVSDIVFTNDNLNKLPQLMKSAVKTMRIVKENIAFSIICKVVCLVLGSLGFTGLALAIFADTGVAVLAVFNSIRALKQ